MTITAVSMACCGVFAAEEPQGKPSAPASQTVVFKEAGGAGGDQDVGGSDTRDQAPNDGGVDDAGTMPQYQSYDQNTGLPNDVPSDSYGEFD